MEDIVEKKLANEELSIKICEEFGLKEFDSKMYIELETLGEGAFGIVKKCLNIKNRELHAIKTIKVKDIDREEMIENIATFLIERDISKQLLKVNHPNISSFQNNYYIIDESRKYVQSLVLVTEAGDYSLKQLVECRLSKKKNPPYSPEEALKILIPIANAYKALQENRIYHSDIKLANIVYNEPGNKFILIDFGVSNIISEPQEELPLDLSKDETEIGNIVRGGTPNYDSPEKTEFFKNQEINFKNKFNPFKCDMWALGVCLEKMCSVKEKSLQTVNLYFKKILSSLKEVDWRKRFDAKELCNYLAEIESEIIDDQLDFRNIEKESLLILKKKTWEKQPELIENYDRANMPYERLQIAKYRMNVFEKKFNWIVDGESWAEFDSLLWELGEKGF